ncbi:phage portal protein [Candidatus Contubernalis alkalaceticus]|nr:phage portal protein [Candidatus Contubernalis alkalaceticus]
MKEKVAGYLLEKFLSQDKGSDNLFDRFRSWFEPYNIFTRKASNTLATNETIFAAVSKLSNSMASLPLKLYKDFNPAYGRNADLLINSPNPNMTGFDFIRTMETHRNTSGNGYALKDYDSKYQVRALWILDPGKVTPVIEKDSRELWYEVEGDNGAYYVHNMEMLHVKHIHATGHKGISPIDVLKNTIDFDAKVKEFSLEQLDSAVKASFILKLATQLSKDKKEETLDSFKTFYQENGGVLIQELGTEITPIDRKFLDTNVFEVEKITRTRVAVVYTMSPHMLGEADGVSFSSMEQLQLEYTQGTLVPICTQYEKEFNRKLLTDRERQQGLYFKFNVNALLRGDMKTRGEFYFKGIRSGQLTPNEARALEDRPPLPGGDKLFMSRDLSPIDERKVN